MSNTSKTDWARIDAMSDDEIDTSDIPPLTDEFFSNAKLRMPASSSATVSIRVDPETLAWFQVFWKADGFDRLVKSIEIEVKRNNFEAKLDTFNPYVLEVPKAESVALGAKNASATDVDVEIEPKSSEVFQKSEASSFEIKQATNQDAKLSVKTVLDPLEKDRSSRPWWIGTGLLLSMVISLFYDWKIDLILIPIFIFFASTTDESDL
jgi:hypothetical protein